jgi:hypothetical protein
MNEVIIVFETGYFAYPRIVVTFDGTNIQKYYDDSFLSKAILEAVIDAGEEHDLFDFAALVFTGINQSVKRRAVGQELMLKNVEAVGEDELVSIRICR